MNEGKDNADSKMSDLLGRLPREVAPQRDLWPAIETAVARAPERAEQRLAQLPRDVAPPADLWPVVAARIEHEEAARPAARTVGSQWPALLAACLALVAVATILLFGLADSGSPDAYVADAPPATSPSAEELLAPSLFDAERVSSPASSAAFEDARRTYVEQIAEVRDQRESIEESLALYPTHPPLLELWLHAYETELRLIDEAGRVLTDIRTG